MKNKAVGTVVVHRVFVSIDRPPVSMQVRCVASSTLGSYTSSSSSSSSLSLAENADDETELK